MLFQYACDVVLKSLWPNDLDHKKSTRTHPLPGSEEVNFVDIYYVHNIFFRNEIIYGFILDWVSNPYASPKKIL